MYNHVIGHKTFSDLGTQKHGDHQGTFLGTLLILIHIYIYIYIYILGRNFEDLCSVLKLLISHMTWIAFSNEFITLICYAFVHI